MHGITQGAISKAGGGRFGDGALGAFASSMGGNAVARVGPGIKQTMAAAAVGGTASVIGGGKFANGAVTGAFAYTFGSVARDMQNGASFGKAMLDLAGKVWALPNTLLGLAYGGLGYGISYAGYGLGLLDVAPSITIGNNAIQFENNVFAAAGAITIGNTITYGGSRFDLGGDGNVMYRHERPHTIQSQVMGPAYLPTHAILGAGALLFNGSWHGPFNVLETGPQRHPPQPWP